MNRNVLFRYEPFMALPYMSYVRQMSRTDGAWGDHLTLDALSNIYNVRVWVIESAHNYECSLVAPTHEGPATRDIYLGHIGDWHYVSVTSSLVFSGFRHGV